jgi:hypothetical protein
MVFLLAMENYLMLIYFLIGVYLSERLVVSVLYLSFFSLRLLDPIVCAKTIRIIYRVLLITHAIYE